jgi:hypothetical protein
MPADASSWPDPQRIAGGFTRPAKLPVARLGFVGNVFIQQHEALHRQFNRGTTIGNAIGLLSQAALRWPQPLAARASDLALDLSGAQSALLEDVINYVAFERAARRTDEPSTSALLRMLEDLVPPDWTVWRARYGALGLPDIQQEAVALCVAGAVLNIPIYDRLRDVRWLADARGTITKELLEERLESVEAAVLSAEGVAELCDAAGPSPDPQSPTVRDPDADRVDRIIDRLVPTLPRMPRRRVPESIALARRWNAQVGARRKSSTAVDMRYRPDGDAMRELAIWPGGLARAGGHQMLDPGALTAALRADPDLHALVTIYESAQPFRLSRKYNRLLTPGQTYLHVTHMTVADDCSRCVPKPGFAWTVLASEQERSAWCTAFDVDRVIVTASPSSSADVAQLVARYAGPVEQRWFVHWGMPFSHVLDDRRAYADDLVWSQVVTLAKLGAVFWLNGSRSRRWIDVYPIAWDMTDSAVAATGRTRLRRVPLTDPLVLAGTSLLTTTAF